MSPNSLERCTRGRCMSPENRVEMAPLLQGVTPGVFVFRGRVREPSRLVLAPGTWQAPAVFLPGAPLTSPTMPWEQEALAAAFIFQGNRDQGDC